MNEAIWDIQDEITRLEGKLESTGTSEELGYSAVSSLSSRISHLYNILHELEREDDS